MQSWDDIINTAMIGSDKRMITANELPAELAGAAGIILDNNTTGREEKFLQIASLVFNYRQTGVMPLRKEQLTSSIAPQEEKDYCSKMSSNVLKNILAEEGIPLLKLWLQHCNQKNKLIPPEMIPAVLAIGQQQKELQTLIVSCCGKRGEWLGRFNDSWNFTRPGDHESLWLTGSIEQRKIVLKEIRKSDPVKAREWLQKSWTQEDATTKPVFLEIFKENISEHDIIFLEAMSSEKSKKVKDIALDLLKRIPTSPVILQYQQVLEQAVFLKKEKALFGLSSKMVLEFKLPASIADSIFLSGILDLSSQKEFTDDEFIIYQLMQYIPASFWEAQLQSKVEDIINYFQKDIIGKKMIRALVGAIRNFKDERWATLMAQHLDTFDIDLLPLLPIQQQEIYGIKNFESHPDKIISLAIERNTEWGLEFTQAIFRHTAKNVYQYNRSFYNLHIHLIPDKIAFSLEKFTPKEEHLQNAWNITSEYILKQLQLKSQTIQSFN